MTSCFRRVSRLLCHLQPTSPIPTAKASVVRWSSSSSSLTVGSPPSSLHAHLHILSGDFQSHLGFLEKQLKGYNIKITHGNDVPQPATYDVLVSGNPTTKLVEGSPNLKHVILPWGGIGDPMKKLMLNYPQISIHNLHFNATSTAEHALALLLAAARNITRYHEGMKIGDWGDFPDYTSSGYTLEGKRALVLGYGAVGKLLCGYLNALGMKVRATRRNPSKSKQLPGQDNWIFGHNDVRSLLPSADVVIVTVPQTPETYNMFDANEFDLLPRGALFVNIARGPVVNEKALYDALLSHHLGGAGIDVWYNYPGGDFMFAAKPDGSPTRPANLPFEDLPNVTMTPHRGGASIEYRDRQFKDLALMLKSFCNRETTRNKMDLQAGY